MTHGSLFSGIGGFDLAAEWMGWENVFHCEINEFCQKVLKKHWPNAELFTDIKQSDFRKYNGLIDIISGGFPCQPYSTAGKRKGKADDRHLWPEMLRAIREIRPRWVVGENVHGLINWSRGLVLAEIKTDLEAAGYKVLPPVILPACGVNAPHRRDRVWVIAYSGSSGTGSNAERINESWKLFQEAEREENKQFNKSISKSGITTHPNERGLPKWDERKLAKQKENPNDKQFGSSRKWENFPTQSPIRVRDDGIPPKLDGITFPKWCSESIKAAGNAIVPQVVYQIFKVIQTIETNESNMR